MEKNNSTKPALLVSVHIHQWGNRKQDKTANKTVQNAHGNSSGTVNSTKKLLPDSPELQKIATLTGQIREFLKVETLPWMADGTRILSSANYLEFVGKFRAKKSEFEQAVADFVAVYPVQVVEAQAKLAGLYLASDYPLQSQIASCFRCEIDFMPLPDVADFRIDISDAEKSIFESKLKETQSKAMADCWNRLHTVVSHAAEKLQDPKATLRDSLVSNILEICSLLPKLNYTNDPALEAQRVKVEQMAAGFNTDKLRNSATQRQNAAAELSKIMSGMATFMTPKKPDDTEGN